MNHREILVLIEPAGSAAWRRGLVCKRTPVQAGKNGSAGVDARYFQTDKRPEPSAFAGLPAERESVMEV